VTCTIDRAHYTDSTPGVSSESVLLDLFCRDVQVHEVSGFGLRRSLMSQILCVKLYSSGFEVFKPQVGGIGIFIL
jgi:hypothetical protein